MRKWILFIVLLNSLVWLSCSKNEVSLLDAVPKNAEIIVESADSAVIMMFDSLMGSHVCHEMVVDGQPMVYAINIGQDEGFVLVSGSDLGDGIIG